MNKDKIIEFLEDMIDTLTFRRVALLCLLATVMIALLAMFENRSLLFSKLYKNAELETAVQWELSDVSKNELIQLTTNEIVAAVLVTDVDLKKNRRTTKYYFVKDPVAYETIKQTVSKLLPQALFDYDPKNTEQMVAMLNNEFKCTPVKDTVFVRFFPDWPEKYPVVCRLAVPPYFGEFAGFTTIMLNTVPSQNQIDVLKIQMNRVAIEMYLRDVSKKPK